MVQVSTLLSVQQTTSEQGRLSGGQEGRLSEVFYAVLCTTTVYTIIYTQAYEHLAGLRDEFQVVRLAFQFDVCLVLVTLTGFLDRVLQK